MKSLEDKGITLFYYTINPTDAKIYSVIYTTAAAPSATTSKPNLLYDKIRAVTRPAKAE